MDIEQLWSAYRASLKAFLHSKVSDPTEVEDLLQEVLIRSYRKLGTVQDTTSMKAWLFQIANNATIDFYRARGRAPGLTHETLWHGEDEPDAAQQLAQCVEPFIRELPESSAALLRAVDIEGRSQKELAVQLGISYSTLKSRVQKARGELRGLFDECCHMQLDRQGNIAEFEPKDSFCKKC